jgi:hypothetical protein
MSITVSSTLNGFLLGGLLGSIFIYGLLGSHSAAAFVREFRGVLSPLWVWTVAALVFLFWPLMLIAILIVRALTRRRFDREVIGDAN